MLHDNEYNRYAREHGELRECLMSPLAKTLLIRMYTPGKGVGKQVIEWMETNKGDKCPFDRVVKVDDREYDIHFADDAQRDAFMLVGFEEDGHASGFGPEDYTKGGLFIMPYVYDFGIHVETD